MTRPGTFPITVSTTDGPRRVKPAVIGGAWAVIHLRPAGDPPDRDAPKWLVYNWQAEVVLMGTNGKAVRMTFRAALAVVELLEAHKVTGRWIPHEVFVLMERAIAREEERLRQALLSRGPAGPGGVST